jgi:flagellar assembly protein FliH
MQLQRFNFKDFADTMPEAKTVDGKPFVATRNVKPEMVEAPPPPPSFSEEQLKAAERDGYKKGFVEGTQEGRKQAESAQADVERALSETAARFAHSLTPLFADHQRMVTEIREHMPKIALARKVAGRALDANAGEVIADMAAAACETMVGEHKLSITVHESMADCLTDKLARLAPSLPASTDIEILRDQHIPPADCRIEWNQGGMERNTSQLWQQIDKAVDNLVLTARRDTGEQMADLSAYMALPPHESPSPDTHKE